VTFTYADGQSKILSLTASGEVGGFRLAQMRAGAARTPVSVTLSAGMALNVYALTLVDTRTGDFQQVTLGPWRRVLSSDIKLYENQTVLPRAFVIQQVEPFPDSWDGSEAALRRMADPTFDPAQIAIIHAPVSAQPPSSNANPAASAIITDYSAERVVIQAQTAEAGYLLLTDAYYPGWEATVNGQPALLYRADVMFRAVPIPAGKSVVAFTFKPAWWPGVALFGVGAWLAALASLGFMHRRTIVH
jgi:hypothetical protein